MKTTELHRPKSGKFKVFLFIGLSVISISIILAITVKEDTLTRLAHFRFEHLMAIILVWLLLIVSDVLSMMSFTRGTGEKLSFFRGVKVVTIRTFFNVITPFTAGGQPVVIYALKHEGVPAGKGSSIVITKILTFAIFYQTGAIIAFILLFDRYKNNTLVSILFAVFGFLYLALIVLMILSLLSQSFLIFFVNVSAKLLKALHIIKDKKKYKKSAIREAHLARKSFRQFFRKHKVSFFLGTFFNGIMYLCQVLLLYFVLRALNVDIPLWQGFVLSALILFLIAFLPTPGSAGLGEVFFILILKDVVDVSIIGVAVLIWRFFYQYLSAIIGAISSSTIMSNVLDGIRGRKKKTAHDEQSLEVKE